ncbi:MAG TPA: MdtA/MuxA family multidrug efflux RND transporter periplasmic adaptor subunit [Burkholderiaceae bacterium]
MPSAQSGKVMVWGLVGAAVLVAGGLWWWKGHEAAAGANGPAGAASAPGGRGGPGGRFGGANRVQPVSIETVRRKDMRVMVSAIGSITASNTAVVQPQVTGVLQDILFKEGQQVKAGQQLAQIDPRAFQAALGQAEGQLARDKAQLDNARVDLTRYRDLLAKDAIPKQQLDTQDALVRQLDGTVKSDQAAVDSARLQVTYTRVLAPISGRVGLKQVDLGNVVQPGSVNGMVVITQTKPIALVFAVPSANLPQISAALHANKPLDVEAWDRGGTMKLASGRVASTDNSIDPTTDTIKLKALFKNDDDALFPNQAVTVRLQLDTQSNVLAVPSAAVLRGTQGFYVYVVGADSTVATRIVKPGVVDGNWTAIEGPVEPGEKVVIDGVDRLREGAKVEVIAADPTKRVGAAPGGGKGHRGGAAGAASGASAGGWSHAASDASHAASSTSGASSASKAASASLDASSEERPRWLDRLPADQQEKFMKMSPEERKAFIEKRRAERAAQQGN